MPSEVGMKVESEDGSKGARTQGLIGSWFWLVAAAAASWIRGYRLSFTNPVLTFDPSFGMCCLVWDVTYKRSCFGSKRSYIAELRHPIIQGR